MSKSKVYKKKKQASAGIFVVLAVVLVALIVAIIVFTSIDNSRYNGLLEDYTEHEYGQKQDVKLTRAADATTGTTIYVSDEYYYYPDDNVIYDMNKNTLVSEGFDAKIAEIGADLGTVNQAYYTVYTDGADFDNEFGYLQVEATYDGVLEGEEAAAETIWNFIGTLGEEYNVCGLYFTYADNDNYYMVIIDVIDKETVTLEKIQENITTINLTGEDLEVVEGEGDATAEGETEAENTEGEAETENAEAENTEGETAE